MKTVVIWEASDIQRGMRVTGEDQEAEYIIGSRQLIPATYYCLVSLTSGEVSEDMLSDDMAKYLTDHGYIPAKHHEICEECGR